MVKRFVVIGIQGSGKSTQGTLLSHQLKLPYLSTGHIFRELAKEKSPMGRYIKETLNAGLLIPDDKAIEIVEKYLNKSEYKQGYILDGFPRTIHQAKEFSHSVDKIIFIDLPEKEALWRIAGRGDETRTDETVTGVQKRIQLFNDVTLPVVDFYKKQNKLITVDGSETIKNINKEILKQLGKELIGDKVHAWTRQYKTIIGVVGLNGSGKTEIVEWISKKDIPVIRFGQIINDYIDEHKLENTEEIHKKIRVEFRKKYGMAAMAVINRKKITVVLKKNNILIIDSFHSYEEIVYLNKQLPKVNIVIIGVWDKSSDRFNRIKKRHYRGDLAGKERDFNEVLDTNMGPTFTLADYMIINDSTKEELYHKLENVYREIYF